jgi:transcriptional regulator GlxA family with amidase domain
MATARSILSCGTTPLEFVKRVRLRYAAQLLCTTDLPVAAVARKAGYASRTYLSRTFRTAYGKDPQSFRADKG